MKAGKNAVQHTYSVVLKRLMVS